MVDFQKQKWKYHFSHFEEQGGIDIEEQSKIGEFYRRDLFLSVNVLWLIIAVFVPLVLYYVMFKMALAVDKHTSHKKEIYLFLFSKKEMPSEVKESLESFPTNALTYYWLFLASGIFVFFSDLYYPINIANLFIPTPTLISLIVNFFFLVMLSDVISKRLYVHQEWEKEIEMHLLYERENILFFKKRSGLGFMLLSFLTIGIYVYIYLFLVNKEYVNHIIYDYKNIQKAIRQRNDGI